MATKTAHQKLLDLAAKFVAGHKDGWDHHAWESFLSEASKLGFSFDSDEARRYAGNILEGARFFYHCQPAQPARKTAAKKPVARKTASPKTGRTTSASRRADA